MTYRKLKLKVLLQTLCHTPDLSLQNSFLVCCHSGCGRNIGFLYTLLTYNLTCMVMQLFMPQRIYGLRIDKRHDMRQFLGMIWENGNSAHIYVHTLKL